MAKFISLLPWIFICLSLAIVVYKYEKNENIAKEYYILESMTFYLIISFLVGLLLKYDLFLLSTGGILFGIILGCFLKKNKYY